MAAAAAAAQKAGEAAAAAAGAAGGGKDGEFCLSDLKLVVVVLGNKQILDFWIQSVEGNLLLTLEKTLILHHKIYFFFIYFYV